MKIAVKFLCQSACVQFLLPSDSLIKPQLVFVVTYFVNFDVHKIRLQIAWRIVSLEIFVKEPKYLKLNCCEPVYAPTMFMMNVFFPLLQMLVKVK